MGVPYSGNPGNWPANVTVLSGSDLPSSTTFNTAYEGLADRTAFDFFGRAHPGLNWFPEFKVDQEMGSGAPYFYNGPFAQGSALLAAAWDPNTSRWIALIADNGVSPPTPALFATYGMDLGNAANWWGTGAYGITNPSSGACCADPATSGVYWAAAIAQAGGVYVYRFDGSNWFLEDTTTDATWNYYYSVEIIPFTDGSGNKRLIYFYNGASSTLKYALASSPSAWTTALSPPLATTDGWLLKAGGPSASPLAILMPRASGSSYHYWTSPDGVTWTQQNMPAGINPPAGLVWSPAHALWFCIIQATSSTTYVYTSPDGVTWTDLGNGPLNVTVSDLAVIGNTLVAMLAEGSAVGMGAGASRAVFSIDGGVSWHSTQATLDANNTAGSSAYGSAAYTRPRLAGSGNGLVMYDALRARFSHQCGVPAGHV